MCMRGLGTNLYGRSLGPSLRRDMLEELRSESPGDIPALLGLESTNTTQKKIESKTNT